MTHFSAHVCNRAQLEFFLKTPLQEIILEHRFLSRFGELEIKEMRELVEQWNFSGRSAMLQWDLLHEESNLKKAIKILENLPLNQFSAIRVQDLGAANWIRKNRPDLNLHWIVEGSNHNYKSLYRWSEFLIPQLQRIILSNELPGKMIEHCIKNLPVNCEILGLGSILLFYSQRKLISPLLERNLKEDETLKSSAAFNAQPHRKFRTLENIHGTFLFHDSDIFLLDRLSQLSEWGLEAFRLDLRRVPMEWLTKIIEIKPDNLEKIRLLKQEWPFKIFQGFFRANHTDRVFKKMKNPFRSTKDKRSVAVVLEAVKHKHLALLIKKPFSCKGKLWGVTPDGRNLEIQMSPMTDLQSNPILKVVKDQIVLIPHIKFVTEQTLIYVTEPSFNFQVKSLE